MIAGYHRGRSWTGHPLEDECPCEQEACGLVDASRAHPDCDQHSPTQRPRSMRQGHRAEECPGGTDTATVLRLAHQALKHADARCPIHDTTPPTFEHDARYGPCPSCAQPIRVRRALNAFQAAGVDL